ncbi:MAG: cupin domain-containing protein [Oscillospiraceae bacterium]|jgi:cupin 2 domain-containing protein
MNLYSLPPISGKEVETELFSSPNVRIVRIVSRGQASPEGFYYDQDETEWVCVLQGEGVVSFPDGREVSLRAGDTLKLPAHEKHRVKSTSEEPPCVWLCVYIENKE